SCSTVLVRGAASGCSAYRATTGDASGAPGVAADGAPARMTTVPRLVRVGAPDPGITTAPEKPSISNNHSAYGSTSDDQYQATAATWLVSGLASPVRTPYAVATRESSRAWACRAVTSVRAVVGASRRPTPAPTASRCGGGPTTDRSGATVTSSASSSGDRPRSARTSTRSPRASLAEIARRSRDAVVPPSTSRVTPWAPAATACPAGPTPHSDAGASMRQATATGVVARQAARS